MVVAEAAKPEKTEIANRLLDTTRGIDKWLWMVEAHLQHACVSHCLPARATQSHTW